MRITEPLITFYHAVTRPEWARLERPGHGRTVWTQARARFESSWEVDVAVRSANGAVLALGEAKWGQVMGMEHLGRLQRIRRLLIAQDRDGAEQARLLCFSGAGFTDELRAVERDGTAVCLGLDRLYHGA